MTQKMVETMLTGFIFCVLMSYLAMMIYYTPKQIPANQPVQALSTFPVITVVVCYRNEQQHLTRLLASLVDQRYPPHAFNIILFNDASDDDSKSIVQHFLLQCKSHHIQQLDLVKAKPGDSSKKSAIQQAVKISDAELIALTDADCLLPIEWLQSIAQIYQSKNALFVGGKVLIKPQSNRIFEQIQQLELLALAGLTMGSFAKKDYIMCNGANLAFHRATFLQLNPFDSNIQIPGGDDMFLLKAFAQHAPHRVSWMSTEKSTVFTRPQHHFKHYVHQRLRWIAKSKSHGTNATKIIAIVALLANAAVLLSLVQACLRPIPFLLLALVFVLIKSVSDFLLCRSQNASGALFFRLCIFMIPEALLNCMVAARSVFSRSYYWKNRKYNH